MPQRACPSSQDLNEFAVGKVSDERRSQIETHLDECAECQSTLETLDVSNDLLLLALKQVAPPKAFEHEFGLREALRRIEALAVDGSALSRESGHFRNHALVETIRDYKLLEKVGEGGMGAVYKALHTHLGKVVALKILTASRNRDALAIARFKREMKAVGTLEHPNIVAALDAGEFEGTHYLVMQFVDGMDLLRLGSRVSIPLADACEIIRQAAEGLQSAHEHGMVHRDLKPSNLMLTPDGCVKTLDLGLALLSESDEAHAEITSAGQLMGTLDYMAPEQCSTSHTVDIRADIYSLGATLYRLICGSSLLADQLHDTPLKKLAALTSTPVTSTRWEEKGIPPELARVIERMMALSPHDRFSTPAEVARSLATLSQGSDLRALLQKALSAADPDPIRGDAKTIALRASATIDTTPTLDQKNVRSAGTVAADDSGPKSPTAVKSVGRWPLSVKTAVLACLGVVMAGLVIGAVSKLLISQVPTENLAVEGKGDSPTQPSAASSSVNEITNSPFDQLTRSSIPANELAAAGNGDAAQAPAELVAVLGDSRLKHWAAVNDVAFTRDGGLLVSASDDSTVRLWDTSSGNMVRQLDTEGPSRCLAVSPDGQRVAASFQASSIRIWDRASGEVFQTFKAKQGSDTEIWSMAFSPNQDSPLLAASCQYSGLITVWNPDTGQELRAIPAHQNTIVGLSFSRDGKWLASAGAEDGTAKIWNVETGDLRHAFNAKDYVSGAAFTPDGDKLVVGSRREITIWDTTTGELLRTIPGGGAEHFVLTPDGDGILFARGYQALLLKFDSPDEPQVVGWNYMNLSAVAISSDGRHAATAGIGMPYPCSDGAIRLWDMNDGSELHPSDGHASAVNCVALRTDAQVRLIASGSTDHTVRLWDPATGQHLKTLSRPAHVNHISFQPGSRNLVAGHDRHNVVWDPETGEKLNEWMLNGWAMNGAFTPDGQALLGGCMDGNVYRWNASSGELLQTIDAVENDANSVINVLAINRSGSILAMANYERGPHRYEFKLWDLQTNKELHSLDHGCPIRSAAFSPDERRLATAGEWDNTAKIWDVETGELLQTLKGHQYLLSSVCFSPDGTRLATSARDGTVRVWDHWDSPATTTVRSIRLGPALGHVNQAVFSHDGRYLVTANGNGTVYILRAPQ